MPPALVSDFGSAAVHGAGSQQTITLSLSGVTTTPASSLGGVDFTGGGLSCNSNNTSCSEVVTFVPQSAGLRQDALVLTVNGTLVASAFLHGIGTAPVLRVFPAAITTAAGTANWSYVDGNALAATFRAPQGLATDLHGNVYIADSINQVVRLYSPSQGIVTTVAGTGNPGFSGDGGPARSANLNNPTGVAVDSGSNLYIADQGNSVVRRVDAISSRISTVAGGGNMLSDGVPATMAALSGPNSVAIDNVGNLYISDSFHNVIRKVDAATGLIATVAGGGSAYGSDGVGDGGPALTAQLNNPTGISFDSAQNLYLADTGHSMVRKVNLTSGVITAVAGTGAYGNGGDGGQAVNATLGSPTCVRPDAGGNLVIADSGTNRVRFVKSATGLITTLAGTGVASDSGDGGFSAAAALNSPVDAAFGADGNILISDSANNVIRQVIVHPPTLTFPSTNVTLTSAHVPVLVGNYGNATLSLSSLVVTPPFQQSRSGGADCTSFTPLAPGATCQVALSFVPAAASAASGTLILASNSGNQNSSQLAVNLAGTGLTGVPVLNASTSTLAFSSLPVGSSSVPQTVTVTNTGNAALSGLGVQLSGPNVAEFSVATLCQSTISPAASCGISVTFTPLLGGARSATLSIYSAAANSPQVISLSGSGSGGPLTSLSATSLQFGPQVINSAASAQVVTLSNVGAAALNIGSVLLSGANTSDFALAGSTCGGSLTPGTSCSTTLSFIPTAVGPRTSDFAFFGFRRDSPQWSP